MKFGKGTLVKYCRETEKRKGKLFHPYAIVKGPGPAPGSSIVNIFFKAVIQRNTCVPDEYLAETSQEEKELFFGNTPDMFSKKKKGGKVK